MPISFGHFPSEKPPTFPAQEPGKNPQFGWDMSIDELDLTVRARNGLMRCGANTVGKVSELIMSDHGLGSVRNLGRKSISEIETALLAKGYEQLNAVERLKFWTQLYPMLLCGQPVAGEHLAAGLPSGKYGRP